MRKVTQGITVYSTLLTTDLCKIVPSFLFAIRLLIGPDKNGFEDSYYAKICDNTAKVLICDHLLELAH